LKRIILIFLPAVAALVLAAPAFANPSLVGWWRLDEGAGTTVHDSSGHGNTGNVSASTAWVNGYFATALSFDGNSDRVTIPDRSSLEPVSAVSTSAWIKGAGVQGNYKYLVAKGASSCMAASYGLYTGLTGGLSFYVAMKRGALFTRSPDATTKIWDGQWHFVVGTYDGSSVRLYVDGAEIGSGSPASGSIGYRFPDNDMFIGHYAGCSNHDFKGIIDEPQVWNGALTASQVLTSYKALVTLHDAPPPSPGSPPPPAPPPSKLLSGGSGGGAKPPPSGTNPRPGPGVPTVAPPKVSHVSLSRLETGRPRLAFNLSAGRRAPLISSFTVQLPRGLGVSRRLKQVRSGVRIMHGGRYRLTLKPANFTVRLRHPARGLSATVRLPALTERASLMRRIQRSLRRTSHVNRTSSTGVMLTLVLRVSDAAGHRFRVAARVRAS
jgi:Concanavalin A-like lectin/glucanases superfamily